MSDERLRDLERCWRRTGEVSDGGGQPPHQASAADGANGFYKGRVAQRIADATTGGISIDDLKDYTVTTPRARARGPISFAAGGADVDLSYVRVD